MRASRKTAAGGIGFCSLLMAIAALLLVASPASAATVPFGPKLCPSGSGTAQCDFVRGVAVNRDNGHVIVADTFNFRVSEFTAWGEFVKSWGWGVDTGAAELETCTTASGCQKGLQGTGPGQFKGPGAGPTGVAVDSAGNVYVTDPAAYRVQKFDPDGNFLLMFGGDVNQGPGNPGDLCTAADLTAGDTCGAGTAGAGEGEFVESWSSFSNLANNIAVGLEDEVYVGDKGRVQEFDSGGNFVRVLPDPDDAIEDKAIGGLAVDPASGDLYLAHLNTRTDFQPPVPDVFRLDEETGELIDTLEAPKPVVVAADEDGNVYVFDQAFFSGSSSDPLNHGTRIFKFDSTGTLIETIAEPEAIFDDEEIVESFGIAASSTCFGEGEAGLYVGARNPQQTDQDYFQPYGPSPNPNPDPTLCPQPQLPPSINAQFASAVTTTSATLKAQINPHFFTPPIGTTTYYVQWGTAECIATEGYGGDCAKTTPVPPAELNVPPTGDNVTTAGVVLTGLAENATYRFRFVSEGSGKPGVEIIGVGGTAETPGSDSSFTTRRDETIEKCANDRFREQGGRAGMSLRDCRAYELVSPIEKGGGDVQARLNLIPGTIEARDDQASLSGNQITFSAYRAFEDPESAPFSSQYLTTRTAGGWQTEAISPPQEGEGFINPLYAVDNLYRYFSPDLSQSWLYTLTEPVLADGGLEGEPNVYRRESASGEFEACTTTPVLSSEDDIHTYQLQGVAADGDTAAFRLEAKLTANGSDATKGNDRGIYQAYICEFGPSGQATVHLVSVLPNGTASNAENTVGGPANETFQFAQGRSEGLENAISADGTRVFWTASPGNDAETPGALYVRLNPAAEESDTSGLCDEEGKACTQEIAPANARFLKASDDGSTALFSVGEQLSGYEVANDATTPIASGFLGLVGASEDLSRIYFISEDEIGGEGTAGEPNLYLGDKVAETTTYIATLSDRDATQGQTVPSPGNFQPAYHTARVTADGSTVVFMSNSTELASEVAGYDNVDQVGGTPAAEVYRYEAEGELDCISCNPTGARPQGREIQNQFLSNTPPLYAASLLPPWLNGLYAPRVLSDDGDRVFFESFEPLTSGDANTKSDVYQWEALGKGGDNGGCEATDTAFQAQSNGCLSLISSGKSPNDSQFVDASPTGDDVFIRTASSLVEWDPGAIDIYDVRVGGGLEGPPLPWSPDQECKGEACPAPAAAPAAPVPNTTAPTKGNVKEGKKCRKGTHKVKRKGKVRCVKNKKRKGKAAKGKAGKSGRAGR